jgi:hypothetical protein
LFRTTTLRGFTFSGWFSDHLDLILDSPEVANLVALRADNGMSESDPPISAVESIVGSSACTSLQWLALGYLTAADADVLTRPSCRLRLRRFTGHDGQCSAAAVKRLLASDMFLGLHQLRTNLSEQNAVGGMQALARLPELHTLESLNSAGLWEVAALPRAGRFPALARLALHGTSLRGAGAEALAKAKMPCLSDLALGGCKLQKRDVVTLARSPLFANLRSLLVADPIGDQAVLALAESGCAAELRRLELQWTTLGNRGLLRIATAFPKLIALVLYGTKLSVTPDGVSGFFAALQSPLRSLCVPFPMSDQAARALAGNPVFDRLEELTLGDATGAGAKSFTVKGLTALLTSPHLLNLRRLQASGEGLDKALPVLREPSIMPRLRELRLGVSSKVGEKIGRDRPGLSVR